MEFLISLGAGSTMFLLVVGVGLALMADRLRVETRLARIGARKHADEEEADFTEDRIRSGDWLKRILGRVEAGRSLMQRVGLQLEAGSVLLRPEEYLGLWLLAFAGPAGVVLLISRDWMVALGLSILGAALPPFLVRRARKKRLDLFNRQLGDALTIMSNCLRAGFTCQQSMESIATEMPEPISKEFGKTLREMKHGAGMDQALTHMVERMGSDDLHLLVSAILIQRQVGGNLSEILDNIAGTVKERLRLRAEIKVVTASGRMSGLIIGLLPLFILCFLMVLKPDYVRMFFETRIGLLLIGVALVLETIGFLLVKKIVTVKF